MLKEEDIEKKRLAGVKGIKKRTTQSSDSDTYNKRPKTNNDNDQNTIYELPVVCFFNKLKNQKYLTFSFVVLIFSYLFQVNSYI